ncbi:MAG TPA: GNAT family N-acetyltransferase [Gemmatimonadaceae bacterium]|nr:GNAT family N-acetyltransferase [Gemmatimonadaceae bacterium]
MTDDRDLMRLHVEALFIHDALGQLVSVNEPDGAPAPRFFLGKTAAGVVYRFRQDVDFNLREELTAASADIVLPSGALDAPRRASRCEQLLARAAPVRRTWAGPAFYFPPELPASAGTVRITEENAHLLHPLLAAWLPDVQQSQPMCAVVVDGQAAAVCCSVRRTDAANEAAVETAPSFRGRGYAAGAVAAWAATVRDLRRVPLYSTSWQNEPSRAVARKLALIHFGSDLHIT